MRRIVLTLLVLSASCMPWVPHGHAQQRHEEHHASYQDWVNKNDQGCCNNQDCGELAPADERESAGGIEVKIDGTWCPIHAGHYLKKGNAPNWTTSHVCVQKASEWNTQPPCERLLCYQPKPKV